MADQALLVCVLIFAGATAALLRWPLMGWLVFLQSVAAAAIVGGIADWYGVVSIYGRPLGISYRTEIIVQKRTQLIAAMRSFVCDDLLSYENIHDKLRNYSLAERLLELFDYRQKDGPFVWLSNFGSTILFEVVAKTSTVELAEQLSRILAGTVERISPTGEIIRIARWSMHSGYADRFLSAVTPGLQKIVGNNGFRAILRDFAEAGVDRYVGDSSLRQIFVEKFLHEQLVQRAGEQVVFYLEEIEYDLQHPFRLELKDRMDNFLDNLEKDSRKQADIDAWLRRLLQSEEIRESIATGIDKLRSTSLSRDGCRSTVETLLKGLLDRLYEDPLARNAVNQWLLEQLSSAVERHHDQIGAVVDESLTTMDKSELVQFVREGIENDLQLIRVNGMMFGMLIGMVVAGIRLAI